MGLTIIYGFRNREPERVRRSLDSLKKQSDPDFNVVFIDYGSDEGLSNQIEKLAGQYSFCRYLYNDTRGRPWNRAHAINTGIKMARDEFVFTADVDLLFHRSFVEIAKGLCSDHTATFFSVAYLNRQFSNWENIKEKGAIVSKSHALGLALIPVSRLKSIGGYDEFYSFWGQEDNDIELRLKEAGLQTQFFDSKILLFHQWHAISRDNELDVPKGWGVMQQDYVNFFKKEMVRNKEVEWGKCFSSADRPAWMKLTEPSTQFTWLDSRVDFLQYYLQDWINRSSGNETIALQWSNASWDSFRKSKLTKLTQYLQNIMDTLKIPVLIGNRYRKLYSNPLEIRDMVARITIFNRTLLKDYAWIITNEYFRVVLIK